jgi:acyl carrier protein
MEKSTSPLSDELKSRCMKVLEDHLPMGAPSITGETRLVEDLDMDSLDLLEFKWALENALGHNVSNRKAANVKTVDDLFELVRKVHGAPK